MPAPLPFRELLRQTPFLRLLAPVVAAVLSYPALENYPAFFFPALCLGLLAVALITERIRQMPVALMPARTALLLLTVYAIGLWACRLRDIRHDPHWIGRQSFTSARDWVVVEEAAPATGGGTRCLVSYLAGEHQGRLCPATGRLFLHLAGAGIVGIGDTLAIPAARRAIDPPRYPFEFDYRRFAAGRQVYHQQFAQAAAVVRFPRDPATLGLLQRAHDGCLRLLATYLRDPATRGLLQAMIAGDERSMDPQLRRAYADTGVIHAVAISGSHLNTLFAVLSALLCWIRRPQRQWIKYLLGVVAVTAYVLMAGAPPSAVRAAIMFCILAAGISFNRTRQALNQLMAAAFFLLLFRPEWLWSVGFQLSFGAVLSLTLFYRPLLRLWPVRNRILAPLRDALAMSVSAQLLIAPLLIWYFHSFSPWFLVANLLASVLMNGVLILGMAILAFGWLPPVAGLLARCAEFPAQLFDAAIVRLQSLNPLAFSWLRLSGAQLVLAYGCLLLAALLWMRPRLRTAWLLGCGLALWLAVSCLEQSDLLGRQRLWLHYRHGAPAIALIDQGRACGVGLRADSLDADRYLLAGLGARSCRGTLPDAFVCGHRKYRLWPHPGPPPDSRADCLLLTAALRVADTARIDAWRAPLLIVAARQPARVLRAWQEAADRAGRRIVFMQQQRSLLLE